LTIVGICLMVTAALLAFAYFYNHRPDNYTLDNRLREHDIRWSDAFIIGCAQAVAVLPGLSRSGSTIATGLILGDRRDRLAQFSFFMVIIPILGEALLSVKDWLAGEGVTGTIGMMPVAIGFIASFVVGCLACKWMIALVKKGKLVWFAVYCALVGILCLVW
ncbi:MAG: undecaprenyl-diphosphate phosphatase, partial [Paramuribaculum sp.]|nr:undecaprenyl-diphosphate phosphatase [Paramuribaculum sp.]